MSSVLQPRVALLSPAEPLGRRLTVRLLVCIAASLFVAVCAHISVPIPFTPVPATMQTFAVILVGMTLGPVGGCLALILYLAEGALGLPVFSPQGPGGILQLLGPTAGYLFAYPIAAALAGSVVRFAKAHIPVFAAALTSGFVALLPVYVMGAMWLAHFTGLDSTHVVHLAITPFLSAEVCKLLATAAAYTGLRSARRS